MDFPIISTQALNITALCQQLCKRSRFFPRSGDGKSGKQYFMSLRGLFILKNTQLFSLIAIAHS